MYKYHNLNPISKVGLDEFTKDYAPVSTPETADAILVRSAAMHEMEICNRSESNRKSRCRCE